MLWRRWRLTVGWFKRWLIWEFWPPWFFYLPIILWVSLLSLRYLGPLKVTSVNPGISAHGKFLLNTKSDKLSGFSPEYVAPFELLKYKDNLGKRTEKALEFAKRYNFPVVLKPDLGGRGAGVWIVKDSEQLKVDIELVDYDAIIQAYVSGVEYGIFWIRHPKEKKGHVVSITEKRLPRVTGDGNRTLEELVLTHPRSVCMAQKHLTYLSGRHDYIPKDGEKALIGEIGTHSLGTLFLDGNQAHTPELESRFSSIARSHEGFYFGRFDVRAPSIEHLKTGKEIQILELNALFGEMTHIWDSRLGLINAWSTLCRQWSQAYSIGAYNQSQGAPKARYRDVLKETWNVCRLNRRHKQATSLRNNRIQASFL